jgi:hypothetical protein
MKQNQMGKSIIVKMLKLSASVNIKGTMSQNGG